MPSVLTEQTQFIGTNGLPIVNGSIYIGDQNSDPVLFPQTIYSDRELTTTLDNPQSTDSHGRSVNKIFLPGKYSIQVNDSTGVQQFQDLDAGDIPQTGISVLTNVQGTNTITAEAEPAIATLSDQQQYNFTAAAANTGAVTLQIDLTAAKAIKKLHDVDLASGDIEANQIVSVVYNGTDDVFELVSNVAVSLGGVTVDSVIFPATQVPSADVNALDDYEEGTWTPSLGGDTTYLTQTGTYTKIGRLVFVQCELQPNVIGTGSVNVITGLPFAASADSYTLAIKGTSGLATAVVSLSAYILASASEITLRARTAASTGESASAIFGNSTVVYISGCYHV